MRLRFHPLLSLLSLLSLPSARLLFVLLVTLMRVGPAGAAGLTVDSQTRSIVADGFVENAGVGTDQDSQFVDEPGPGVLDATVDANAAYELLFEAGSATASATQFSDIKTVVPNFQLEASGSGAASMSFDILDPGADSYSEAAGDAFFQVVFTLDTPAHYTLAASLTAELRARTLVSGPGPIDDFIGSFVELSGNASGIIGERTIVDVNADGSRVEALVGKSGMLAPDTYTLQVGAVAEGSGFEDAFGNGQAAFGFEFLVTVPEPAAGGMQALAGATLLVLGFARRLRRTR